MIRNSWLSGFLIFGHYRRQRIPYCLAFRTRPHYVSLAARFVEPRVANSVRKPVRAIRRSWSTIHFITSLGQYHFRSL